MRTELSAPSDPVVPSAELPAANTLPRRSQAPWLALLVVGPALLVLLLLLPSLDRQLWHNAASHLLVTFVASVIGVFLALAVLFVARRAQDGRVFLIGMGFLATASILLTHSLSTPDVLMSGRGRATALSAVASLFLGAIFFALSSLNISSSLNRLLMRYVRIWLLAFLVFCLAYNWLVLVSLPELMTARASGQTSVVVERPTSLAAGAESLDHAEHQQGATTSEATTSAAVSAEFLDTVQDLLAFIGLGCYALALWRHCILYRRSPSRAGLVLIYGIAFFGEALLSQHFSQVYTISFWLYHAQEFIGFGVIGYAALGAYRRGQTDESLLESLFLAGTRARMQASYGRAMDALVGTLSRGDQPTTALREALRERFGLSESQLQVLEGAARSVAEERRQRQEFERLNAALRQLEDHKRQLTQMIVHDLKNPLTALVGFLEILRLDRLNDDQRVLVESALRSGRNLSDLIGDLLDVGRIEEGRLELDRGLFAPRHLLDDCAEELRGWLIQAGKVLTVDTPKDLPLLDADLRLMRRVILNLLSNAIKHTPPGTRIALRAFPLIASPRLAQDAAASDRQIVIEVEDDGPGIPADHLERIFEKFGRFNSETNTRQDSTGLGLTFCRLVVEAHGGAIRVSSVVDQGTTFRVTLPAI